MSAKLSFLLISFLLALSLIFTSSHAQSPASSPTSICPSHDCGNGLRIRYPFWVIDNQTTSDHFCGYPDFGLTCSDSGDPILKLPNDNFFVRDINYSDNTLTLVDVDVVNQKCPRARHNISIGTLPLEFSEVDVNISFYFNCTASPSSVSHIPCLGTFGGNRLSYVIEEGDEIDGFKGCEEKVVVTVKRTAVVKGQLNNGGFGTAMNGGFDLDWRTAKDCGACESTKGFCGFNETVNNFLCFCEDGSIQSKMCRENPVNIETKVIVGVVAAFAGVLLACIGCYLYQRRKKKLRIVRSTLLSRSISADDSSVADLEKGKSLLGIHLFTYAELEEATNYFDSAKEVGDGGFGTVYYGELKDGRAVAVKRLYENNYKRVEQFMNEVEILTRLRHNHLVSLFGCTSRHSRELLLVYEFVPNGTVADNLHGERAKPGALPWHIRLKIAIETATALTYLHATDIIHRDVKTNNILLDNNFSVKVADFGLSRLFPTDVTHVSTAPQGTPGYVDPEYHQCYQLTGKSDVFSFGVVLIELISSLPAVDITRHRHEINLSNLAINKIQSHALHEIVDPSLGFESDSTIREMITAVAEVAFQCLQSEKDMRPSMLEVLESLLCIQSQGYNTGKAEEMDIPAADVVLLKSGPLQLSPESETVNLVSRSTTSDTSN